MCISCSDSEDACLLTTGLFSITTGGRRWWWFKWLVLPSLEVIMGDIEGLRVASGERDGVKDGVRAGEVKLDS